VREPMHRAFKALLWVSFSGMMALPGSAYAQHPLCPAPTAEDTYYFTCRPGTDRLVASFLYDFSIRHLFKGPETFEIPTESLLDVLDLGKLLDSKKDDRKTLLKDRPVVVFRPLDGTTGEFKSVSATGSQTFKISYPDLSSAGELTIPEVIEGLYWRSPAHLELQFYKGHGIHFRLTGPGVPDYEDGLQCLSITASRARATTGDPTHRYFMSLFERCQ
jgi:hypothetical protein